MELKSGVGRRKIVGVVVKDKMDKSVVIEVEKFLKHPKYHKYLRTKPIKIFLKILSFLI